MAVQRRFKGNNAEVASGTVYHFDEDGHVTIEEDTRRGDSTTISETYVDVSANWDAYLALGDHSAVCRWER
jgi:hypothetical protein